MHKHVENVIASAKKNVDRAADAKGVEATVFYCDQAIVTLLGAILQETHDTNERLKRLEERYGKMS